MGLLLVALERAAWAAPRAAWLVQVSGDADICSINEVSGFGISQLLKDLIDLRSAKRRMVAEHVMPCKRN